MARTKRQKLDRSSTAAYAASQPLFDALSNATKSIAEQQNYLTSARDIVQHLHAKIVNGDGERHQAYMDSAVNAWRSAVDTYCTIFDELVIITAADPSEGREAGKRCEEFGALLQSAKGAKTVLRRYTNVDSALRERDNRSTKVKAEQQSRDDELDAEPASTLNATGKRPMVAITSVSDKDAARKEQEWPESKAGAPDIEVRYDKTGTKILWAEGQLKVPREELTPEEVEAWTAIKKRKKRQSSKRKRALAKKIDAGAPIISGTNITVGAKADVEFEDLSAEVEARLKAKQEKRQAEKAKQAEKKRKRDSRDSFIDPNTGTQETDPLAALEQELSKPVKSVKPEEPAKKKSRTEQSSSKINGVDNAQKGRTAASKTNGMESTKQSHNSTPSKSDKRKKDVDEVEEVRSKQMIKRSKEAQE